MNTRPNVARLAEMPCPASATELEDAIRASECIDVRRSFENLLIAIRQTESFLENTLPFLWQEALRAAENLPDIPVLNRPGTVTLTQRECLGILANAFFCTYSDRVSNNCACGPDVPSINLDELYAGQSWGGVKVAKLRMLFNYFEQCRRRLVSGSQFSRPVRTIRRQAENVTAVDWRECRGMLVAPVVHPLEQSLDEAKGMLQVDFANRLVGGGALAYGCVQEEIMFCVCPELIVSRLFCPAMKPDEAIIFVGAEQFSRPLGYASRLGYGGTYVDPTPAQDDGALATYVVAIDAIDLRSVDPIQQYSPIAVVRELVKAWAGFDAPGTPATIATGNWGCGAFGGDAELKSIIQWLATSRAGKVMHYFPWGNEGVYAGLPELAALLTIRRVTVGALATFLLDGLRPGPVFEQVREHFTR